MKRFKTFSRNTAIIIHYTWRSALDKYPLQFIVHKCRNKSNTYLHAAELKTQPHPFTI